MYIKNLSMKKNTYIKQLQLLINFKNEYIKKLNIQLKSGVYIDSLNIYNDFIYMLYIAIEENKNIVKTYEKKIKNNIDKWFNYHLKLNTWDNLNTKNKIVLNQHKILKENILNDEFSQFKFFKIR